MWSVRKLTVFFVLAMALCGSGTAIAFDETDLKKFKALNRCIGCDLNGANLEEGLWIGASLWNANLIGANLSGANLSGADLESANFSGADLSTTFLTNVNLDSAILCKTLTPWGEDNSGCKK